MFEYVGFVDLLAVDEVVGGSLTLCVVRVLQLTREEKDFHYLRVVPSDADVKGRVAYNDKLALLLVANL